MTNTNAVKTVKTVCNIDMLGIWRSPGRGRYMELANKAELTKWAQHATNSQKRAALALLDAGELVFEA